MVSKVRVESMSLFYCLTLTFSIGSDLGCPDGSICYGGMNKARCNAALMTVEPTESPTKSPTKAPTPKREYQLTSFIRLLSTLKVFRPSSIATAPTLSPTLSPTTETRAPVSLDPTISPKPTSTPMIPLDDPRHSYWVREVYLISVRSLASLLALRGKCLLIVR